MGIMAPPLVVLYENTESDLIGDTWLTDSSAVWIVDEFAGMYLDIGGEFAEITGNSETVLWLANNNITATGAGFGYKIKNKPITDDLINNTLVVY